MSRGQKKCNEENQCENVSLPLLEPDSQSGCTAGCMLRTCMQTSTMGLFSVVEGGSLKSGHGHTCALLLLASLISKSQHSYQHLYWHYHTTVIITITTITPHRQHQHEVSNTVTTIITTIIST